MTRMCCALSSAVIMADPEGKSLESWLNKATNPSNRQEEWEYVMGFCDQINKELEGPQISVPLLAHKIQSPQDWESLQALTVLEACMKNCGKRFHNEVGKFRFLNELIKVVSPKYLGDRVSERIKTKIIELLYSWSVVLPHEAKIAEAYQMLKNQGIVTADPEVPLDKTLIPSPKPKNPVFDNEEKSRRLGELLKSKRPQDLQEANRIIKNMVKEEEAIQQKASQRASTLEEVRNSVKLLNEMLNYFKRDDSTQADKELIKDLYNDCDKLRTSVFKLATETDDDSALGDILHASDDLSRVINLYKKIVEEQTIVIDTPGSSSLEGISVGTSSGILIDLAGLDSGTHSPLKHILPASQHSDYIPPDLLALTPLVESEPSFGSSGFQMSDSDSPYRPPPSQLPNSLLLLEEELGSLGLDNLNTTSSKSESNIKEDQGISSQTSKPVIDLLFSSSSLNPLVSTVLPTSEATSVIHSKSSPPSAEQSALTIFQKNCKDLTMLDLTKTNRLQSNYSSLGSKKLGASEENIPTELTMFSLPADIAPVTSAVTSAKLQSFSLESPLFRSLSPTLSTSQTPSASDQNISLTSVYVPLETIKPSKAN